MNRSLPAVAWAALFLVAAVELGADAARPGPAASRLRESGGRRTLKSWTRGLKSWTQQFFETFFAPPDPTPPPTPPATPPPTPPPTTRPPTPYPTPYPTWEPTFSPTVSPTLPREPTSSPRPSVDIALVPAADCFGDYICLQNPDWGQVDESRYNIDLSLQVKDVQYAEAYVKAIDRWDRIVVGNLDSFDGDEVVSDDYDCYNGQPAEVDDAHLCARHLEVDGEGGFVGLVTPVKARQGDDGKLTIITATIDWDANDVAVLFAEGRWDDAVLSLMGNALNFNLIWFDGLNGVLDGNFNYVANNGKEVWVGWGCNTDAPPVAVSPDNHVNWDACLNEEIMTGLSSSIVGRPVSELTIAAFEDNGYTVDYDAADPFDGTDASCCFPGVENYRNPAGSPPTLTPAGRAAAEAIGRERLGELSQAEVHANSSIVDLGGSAATVFYEEGGHIFTVLVTA